ncbi:MAG: heavy-metal-associated domain-containing protein [Spirochaetes bacterium]|nr:heavy-metal-associated domain-containing protein [Spirochaetota bacterium]
MEKNTKIYKINGMSCNHCVMAVTNSIKTIAGVQNVDVDLKKNQAVVEGKSFSDEAVINAVAEAGYNASIM